MQIEAEAMGEDKGGGGGGGGGDGGRGGGGRGRGWSRCHISSLPVSHEVYAHTEVVLYWGDILIIKLESCPPRIRTHSKWLYDGPDIFAAVDRKYREAEALVSWTDRRFRRE